MAILRGVLSTRVTIKDVAPDAYDALAALLSELYASEGRPTRIAPEDVAGMMAQTSPKLSAIVAYDGDTAVGAVIYYQGFDVQSMAPGVHIADMVVAARYRKRGIGRQMIAHVAERTRLAGGAWMSLTCLKENLAGNKFYQALGFQMVSVQFYAIGASGMEALSPHR